MKALILLSVLAQAPGLPTPAPTLPRADAHVVLGWQNLHKPAPENHYDDWVNNIFYAGAGAGWYWTDHVKTQVDFGAGTRGQQYRSRSLVVNGVTTYESARLEVRQQAVSVGQQYQFFRNQWFHPHIGAGLEIARETSDEEYPPIVVFDGATRTSRQLAPARREREHRVITRPFIEAGMKAYMTRRAFFTADSRVMVRNGIDQVLFRFGFGFDF